MRDGVAPWREECRVVPGGHGEEAEEHIELECLSLGWRKGRSVDPEMGQVICLAVGWPLRGESRDTR